VLELVLYLIDVVMEPGPKEEDIRKEEWCGKTAHKTGGSSGVAALEVPALIGPLFAEVQNKHFTLQQLHRL
jgi:hypothetical protein